MSFNHIGGCFGVEITPAVLIVRTRAPHVRGGVDEEGLEHAGAHQLAGEILFVELLQECGGA